MPEYLSRKEACKRLFDCSTSTLERRINAGLIEAIVEQGRVLVSAESVERYLANLPKKAKHNPKKAKRAPTLADLGLVEASA